MTIKRSDKFRKAPFSILIKEEQELIDLRNEYSSKTESERLKLAEYVYYDVSAIMPNIFELLEPGYVNQVDEWPAGICSLAIAPNYAPAILTVGSQECQLGRIDEGMKLFLSLLELDEKTEDLHIIIDKCGDCLLDLKEYDAAYKLYKLAEKKYKNNILYLQGLSYTLSKLGKYKEALEICRKIVKLEPEHYEYLSDLGYSLIETGNFTEAEKVLKKAIKMAPEDYVLAKGNLDYLNELRAKQND